MSKWFCPVCMELTYSLRYVYEKEWFKPDHEPQWCRSCKEEFPAKKCMPLTKVEKKREVKDKK